MHFISDIHIHSHNLLPQPFRSVYRFANRKTIPKLFKLEELQNLPINLAIVNAVGDAIVNNLYLGSQYHGVKVQLRKILKQINKLNYILFEDYSSIEEGIEADKPVIILGVEGGDFLNNKIERLKEIYDLGVRALTLVHSEDNCIGHATLRLSELLLHKPNFHAKKGGLTSFGKKVIEEMNSLNMIIDVAHATEETAFEVIEHSTSPVIASHTGVLALQSSFPRYISDDLIKATIQAKGLIGAWPLYHHNFGCPDLQTFIEHIKHIKSLGGIENIAIGTDINGIPGIAEGFVYPDSLLQLKELLQEQEFSPEEVEKILGNNSLTFLRTYRQ